MTEQELSKQEFLLESPDSYDWTPELIAELATTLEAKKIVVFDGDNNNSIFQSADNYRQLKASHKTIQ